MTPARQTRRSGRRTCPACRSTERVATVTPIPGDPERELVEITCGACGHSFGSYDRTLPTVEV